jgi:FMN phosphatase YigB (HAD superfamily)
MAALSRINYHFEVDRAAIVDLDGTLVDVTSIRYLVEGDKKNFNKFHESSAGCPANPKVAEFTKLLFKRGFKIIIMSGRVERYSELSSKWLLSNNISFHELLLRKNDDFRPDVEVKRDLFRTLNNYKIQIAIDDRNGLRDLWKELGVQLVINPLELDIDESMLEVDALQI